MLGQSKGELQEVSKPGRVTSGNTGISEAEAKYKAWNSLED